MAITVRALTIDLGAELSGVDPGEALLRHRLVPRVTVADRPQGP